MGMPKKEWKTSCRHQTQSTFLLQFDVYQQDFDLKTIVYTWFSDVYFYILFGNGIILIVIELHIKVTYIGLQKWSVLDVGNLLHSFGMPT